MKNKFLTGSILRRLSCQKNLGENESYKGYKGKAKAKLKELGVRVWSDVEVEIEKGDI